MENEEIYRSLVILLKMFKNRPYHLAKYLVENSALTSEFIVKLKNSEKLKEMSDDEKLSSEPKLLPSPVPIYFVDISQMESFYNSLIDDLKSLSREKDVEQITKDLNEKLEKCIQEEKYEDAARIRDYMVRNGIKRIL